MLGQDSRTDDTERARSDLYPVRICGWRGDTLSGLNDLPGSGVNGPVIFCNTAAKNIWPNGMFEHVK